MSLFYITALIIIICTAEEELPGNRTDFTKCKISHLGLEYLGDVSVTAGGIRCQSWSAGDKAIHTVNETYHDDMFPDGSRKAARNYCRNPNKNKKGPWCYTMDVNLIDDSCELPLCSLTECRLSGPGMEYAGLHNKGVSG